MKSSTICGFGVLTTLLAAAMACAPPEPPVIRQSSNVEKKKAADSPSLGASDPCESPSTGGVAVRALGCDVEMEASAAPPPVDTIKASISVVRRDDTAMNTNCLKIQINGGPEVDLGCNHGAIVPQVQVDALPRPGCNQVRLVLFSNGQKVRTTESALNVARDFRIVRTASGFAIQCNDNSDDDFNDLNLEISSNDALLSIENTGFGCQ